MCIVYMRLFNFIDRNKPAQITQKHKFPHLGG